MNDLMEWVGGSLPAPVTVNGEDVDYQPQMSVWMEVNGPVVGATMESPRVGLASAVELLRQSINAPMEGPPRKPHRVRTADPELAGLIRKEFGNAFEVVVADTPELIEMLENMREYLERPPGYLEFDDITEEQVASFFKATAALYRSSPWDHIHSDQDLLTVDIEAYGVKGHVISVIGRLGESIGFIVFSSRGDFERFLTQVQLLDETHEPPDLPPYLSVNFEGGDDVPQAISDEVAEYDWEIADDNAYPVVTSHSPAGPTIPWSDELAKLEAISNALVELVKAEPSLEDAWELSFGLSKSFSVMAGGKRVDVRLSVPSTPVSEALDSAIFDIRAVKLDRDGNLDERWATRFEEEVLKRFEASKEGAALDGESWMTPVLDYARSYFNLSVAQIGAMELREILFELFPRKISCKPECATAIVSELRAFWTWAKREFALEKAEECLAMLHPGVEEKLFKELANTAKFGMAKSIFMGAIDAGYDMQTRAGIDRFMSDANAGRIPLPFQPGFLAPQRIAKKKAQPQNARKKKRKAQKAARKRGR